MKTQALTLTRIGKSRGVRLPAAMIRRHGFAAGLILEDRGHEIVLRPKEAPRKLSWEETYREMAAAKEDWSEWDCTMADGLDEANAWSGPLPKPAKSRPRRTSR